MGAPELRERVGARQAGHLRSAIDSLATNLDGKPAAPNYFNRRRGVLHNALRYAVELRIFDSHPMAEIADTWIEPRKARARVDKRVYQPRQAKALLESVGDIQPSGPRLKAFFGAMYYAVLRPEEAVELVGANLDIPAGGWGEIHLDHAAPDSGSAWTNSGRSRERRQLKHRGVGDGRTVPCPPQLTALLQQHLQRFRPDHEGRLFRGVRNGRAPDSSTYERTWRRARKAALTPLQVRSPLGKRPYDLRHAAVSTWLNAASAPHRWPSGRGIASRSCWRSTPTALTAARAQRACGSTPPFRQQRVTRDPGEDLVLGLLRRPL